jgi:hypothetical protein
MINASTRSSLRKALGRSKACFAARRAPHVRRVHVAHHAAEIRFEVRDVIERWTTECELDERVVQPVFGEAMVVAGQRERALAKLAVAFEEGILVADAMGRETEQLHIPSRRESGGSQRRSARDSVGVRVNRCSAFVYRGDKISATSRHSCPDGGFGDSNPDSVFEFKCLSDSGHARLILRV